jgi:hypothetical protein
MRLLFVPVLLALLGCVEVPQLPQAQVGPGCPYPRAGDPIATAYYNGCVAAYEEEMAKARGATVEKCYPAGDGSFTCISG